VGRLSRCRASAKCRRLKNCQAAATAVRHVFIASARSMRCVWADVAHHGLRRLDWAESAVTRVASRRTGVGTIAVIGSGCLCQLVQHMSCSVNPIGAGFCARPPIVPTVRLVGLAWREISKIGLTQGRCAWRRQSYDHDPIALLKRHRLTIDRAQIPALHHLADPEADGAFGYFVENQRDIPFPANRGSLQRQGRPLGFGGRRRRGV
jgi:hypothetical protein